MIEYTHGAVSMSALENVSVSKVFDSDARSPHGTTPVLTDSAAYTRSQHKDPLQWSIAPATPDRTWRARKSPNSAIC